MDVVTAVEASPTQTARQRWSPLARVGFQFGFVYFSLYCLATQIINTVLAVPKIDVPDWTTLWPIRPVVFWVAAHVFGLTTPLVYSGSGSGDKYFDWVLLFCIMLTAGAAAAVWSLFDRGRENYATLHKWFLVFLRLCLGSQMLTYGFVKAFPLQMPFPGLFTLVEPFGNLSPMGVLWSSIGASPAYETFAGCAEILGGLLLIFPRTRTLGALICLVDLTQVFMLNMTYDVPVKLFSFHLVLMSLLILAPEFRRLANFFFLKQTAEPVPDEVLFAGRRGRRIATAVIAFLWVWMVANDLYGVWDSWHQYGPGAPKSPLYGIWNIEACTIDGQAQALLITQSQGWRRIIFDFPAYAFIERMDGSRSGFGATIDARGNRMVLTDPKVKSWKATFSFSRSSPEHLVLDGSINGRKTTLQLQRVDERQFLVSSRGFHWIQDYPFNR